MAIGVQRYFGFFLSFLVELLSFFCSGGMWVTLTLSALKLFKHRKYFNVYTLGATFKCKIRQMRLNL